MLLSLLGCADASSFTQAAAPAADAADGPDLVFNGTTYSKTGLTPDTAFLGVYSVYEDAAITYIKLAIGEDDSAVFIE